MKSPATVEPKGIEALGLQLPTQAMEVTELARLRGVDPNKYTVGLGCSEMALCAPGEGVVDLAVGAAERALQRWGGDRSEIGLLAVGTETAVDMSRPLSAWVADRLGLSGAVRSYEVKHACYGGTLALRQAAEWCWSGAAGSRRALVIAADVALYAPGDPGEPTQGAGAVAMVVGEPQVARLDPASHAWSEPQFDFWRPVGEPFPSVDGPLSLECYNRAAEHCLRALCADEDARKVLGDLPAICFHVPFPKMVKKAVMHLGEVLGWNEEEASQFFVSHVQDTMAWNRRVGNAYTASLWMAVASTLRGMAEGTPLAAFSYGSGFGSELCQLWAGPEAAAGAWAEDVETDLEGRTLLSAEEYEAQRSGRQLASVAH